METTPVEISIEGASHSFNLTVDDLSNLPAIVSGALCYLSGQSFSSESDEYLTALASAKDQLGVGVGDEAEEFLSQTSEPVLQSEDTQTIVVDPEPIVLVDEPEPKTKSRRRKSGYNEEINP